MPENREIARPEIVPWPDAGCSGAVEYSRAAFERLHFRALEGMLALPRVGIGVGGLLLGTYNAGKLRILEVVEIPCAHLAGPSFSLSQQEIEHARGLATATGAMRVVGSYLSKTRRQSGLNEADLALIGVLCPEPWQITLLIRASTLEPFCAALFYRNAAGKVVAGSELEIAISEGSRTVEFEPPKPAPVAVAELLAEDTVPSAAPEPVSSPVAPQEEPVRHQNPLFMTMEPAPSRRRALYITLAGLVAAAGGAAFITRDEWMPRPPLTLAATDIRGHMTLRWNPDSVRGIAAGSMLVNDGGELKTFPLAGPLLEAGTLIYDRKSMRVTATLRVGEDRAIASYFEPDPQSNAPPLKAEPPAQ